MNLLTLSLAILGCMLPLAPSDKIPPEDPIEPCVYFYDQNNVYEMSVEDYVIGVVLHEMPYTFEYEALRAQAVAARTYMYYCLNNKSHPHENGADLCSDINHCCGYITKEALCEKYGEKYGESAYAAVKTAVMSTKGEVLKYAGEAILAVWHSSSHGATENSGEVWQSQLPYLASVSSPEYAARNIISYSLSEVKTKIKKVFPEYNGKTEIFYVKNSSGRCDNLKIGNVILTGTKARELFSLRSTSFDAWIYNGRMYMKVYGYGHGVGLSQYGAEKMALDGADYREILTHYYTGATFT